MEKHMYFLFTTEEVSLVFGLSEFLLLRFNYISKLETGDLS